MPTLAPVAPAASSEDSTWRQREVGVVKLGFVAVVWFCEVGGCCSSLCGTVHFIEWSGTVVWE